VNHTQTPSNESVTEPGAAPVRLWGEQTTANYFSVLGIPAALGGTYMPSDNRHESNGHSKQGKGLLGFIITQAMQGAVAVIARSSSILVGAEPRRASEIGEALRVDYVLEGSVRSDGDRLRITVCLVETIGETHVWSETVECRSTRPLNTQVEVAAHLAQAVTHALRQKDSGVVRF